MKLSVILENAFLAVSVWLFEVAERWLSWKGAESLDESRTVFEAIYESDVRMARSIRERTTAPKGTRRGPA